jgi:hypothetical protein
MKGQSIMQTALSWLLETLESEGRQDLVNGYHERNRAYQREKSIAERERKLAQCKEALPKYDPNGMYSSYLRKMIAKHEAAIEKMQKTEQ